MTAERNRWEGPEADEDDRWPGILTAMTEWLKSRAIAPEPEEVQEHYMRLLQRSASEATEA
jgi:hypothetical protein